jgi:hypothetical protein
MGMLTGKQKRQRTIGPNPGYLTKIKSHRIGSGSILGEEIAESLDPFRRAAKDIGKLHVYVALSDSFFVRQQT